jgi:hypothetical protein
MWTAARRGLQAAYVFEFEGARKTIKANELSVLRVRGYCRWVISELVSHVVMLVRYWYNCVGAVVKVLEPAIANAEGDHDRHSSLRV